MESIQRHSFLQNQFDNLWTSQRQSVGAGVKYYDWSKRSAESPTPSAAAQKSCASYALSHNIWYKQYNYMIYFIRDNRKISPRFLVSIQINIEFFNMLQNTACSVKKGEFAK